MRYVPETEYPTRAHEIVAREGLRVWRHRGVEGVNVHDEALKDEFLEAGANIRPYQPEQATRPERLAWEVVLPQPEEAEVIDLVTGETRTESG